MQFPVCVLTVINSTLEEGCSNVHAKCDESLLLSSDSESAEHEVEQPSGESASTVSLLEHLKIQLHQTWYEREKLQPTHPKT